MTDASTNNRRWQDTSIGIVSIVAGAGQLVYSLIMLSFTFAAAALQIGGTAVQTVQQMNNPNAVKAVSDAENATMNAALHIGVIGLILALVLFVTGILALLGKRWAIGFAGMSALICFHLAMPHFAVAWYGFTALYVAIGLLFVAYATHVVRGPRVNAPSIRATNGLPQRKT